MSSSPHLTPTVTSHLINQNPWMQLPMFGIFYSIVWLLILIIWLCANFCHTKLDHDNYSSSMDISQLTIENDRLYTDVPV